MRKGFLIFCLILALHFKNSKMHDWCDPKYLLLSTVERATYLGAGTLFAGGSLLSHFLEHSLPGNFGIRNDLKTLSDLFARYSFFSLNHTINAPSSLTRSTNGKWIHQCYKSWDENQDILSRVHTFSIKDQNLISFLERRWLAKANGFYPIETHYALPCFELSLQVSPETRNSYARDPFSQTSQVYENRISALKELNPYPLILTRPQNLGNYLPSYFKISFDDALECTLDKMAQEKKEKLIVDLSSVSSWETKREYFLKKCQDHHIPPEKLICTQLVTFGDDRVGGIRILPWLNNEKDYQFILSWISTSGLTANPSELDRILPRFIPHKSPLKIEEFSQHVEPIPGLDQCTSLMVDGFLANLKSICANQKHLSQTEQTIVQISLCNIEKQLQKIREKPSFYSAMNCIEQAYLNLTPLLEIYAPFTFEDFSSLFAEIISPPQKIKNQTTYGLLASGMTSIAGIIKAIEKKAQTKPHIIYGENTYFECIHLAERTSDAISYKQATSFDWENADLLLVQFNPVLKRDHEEENFSYHVEQVIPNIHKALSRNRKKPLTVALDATIDYLRSQKIHTLLEEFQEDIMKGKLNIICYRSGIKFDLFGMDNHSGAPCFMVNNQDTHWAAFKDLFKDPTLLTDLLSLQWFCLAFQNSSHQLDQYRKQIFENTRALLDQIPSSLYNPQERYHVVSCDTDADASFIDIKVSGPFHRLRAAAIVGGSLYLHALQAKHPIFFRRSFGFYHPNFGILFSKDASTVRLTLGLDPSQIDVFAKCLKKLIYTESDSKIGK